MPRRNLSELAMLECNNKTTQPKLKSGPPFIGPFEIAEYEEVNLKYDPERTSV